MRTGPGASVAPFLFCSLVACALGSAPAEAATDPVAANRAYFPDRLWMPQSAADAALAGAGRATDSLSSWFVNPALVAGYADSGAARARITGFAADARRNDIAGNSVNFSDKSPFLSFGETGVAVPLGAFVVLLGADQPGFQREETAFIDTTTGGAPLFRSNSVRAYWQRGTLGAARRFGAWQAGVAVHAYRVQEFYQTLLEPGAIQVGAIPGELDVEGIGVGGVAGLAGRPSSWLQLGAAYRLGAAVDLEDEDGGAAGTDEVPDGFTLGASVGEGLGGNLHLSASWTGERRATLPDTLGRGEEVSPARWETGVGYAYRSRVAPWEFRAGFGWSPYPTDGGSRSNRFGVGLGYDLGGLRARASYANESFRTADGDKSSRGLLLLTVDFDL